MLAVGPRTMSMPPTSSGIEEERAVGEMAGALIILPRAVDHHGDTAEILQAADIDRGRRFVAAVLHPDAGYVVEETAERRSA